MKRFFTVNKQKAEIVLGIIGGTVVTLATTDAYAWLKKKLQEEGIDHHDQHAIHYSELPQKGDHVSFHIDANGIWIRSDH